MVKRNQRTAGLPIFFARMMQRIPDSRLQKRRVDASIMFRPCGSVLRRESGDLVGRQEDSLTTSRDPDQVGRGFMREAGDSKSAPGNRREESPWKGTNGMSGS
jgi:hypothetical protein